MPVKFCPCRYFEDCPISDEICTIATNYSHWSNVGGDRKFVEINSSFTSVDRLIVTKNDKMIIMMFNRQAERITRAVNKHTSLESFRVLMDKLPKSIFPISIKFSSHRALDQDEMKVRDELFTFDGPCCVNNCCMRGPFPNKNKYA